jgi:hypothetical protein
VSLAWTGYGPGTSETGTLRAGRWDKENGLGKPRGADKAVKEQGRDDGQKGRIIAASAQEERRESGQKGVSERRPLLSKGKR